MNKEDYEKIIQKYKDFLDANDLTEEEFNEFEECIYIESGKDHVNCYEPGVFICPHCNAEQAENPQNYIMDDINYVDCDECGKNFYFEEVYYISCFKEGPLEALESIAKPKEDGKN